MCLVAGCCIPRRACAQDTPVSTIDDEVTAMAFAPDGRLAYATRRLMKTRLYDLQRDDIWLQGADGKRRRMVSGEKLVRGNVPFSYTVNSLRWSPDGHLLTAELFTTAVIDAEGNTRDALMTLLFDDNGKEIRIGKGDSVIEEATNAAWLADGVTVVFLTEAVKPKLLFSVQSVRPVAARGGPILEGRTFVAAAWDAKKTLGYGVERARRMEGPPRLQRIDLLKDSADELATLEGFAGGLTVSPSGTKVAYYRDHEVLEIRDVAAPTHVARLRVGFGVYEWTPDERRILLKRSPEKKSGDLVWFEVPPLGGPPAGSPANWQPAVIEPPLAPALHGLSFREFEISPDGRTLAVIQPGRRNLLFYSLD
jgi:hypothetical protein